MSGPALPPHGNLPPSTHGSTRRSPARGAYGRLDGARRSTSGTTSLLIAAVILCSAVVVASSGPLAGAAPDSAATTPEARDSLVRAAGDSAAFARHANDLREPAHRGWMYAIRYSGLGDWYVRGGVFMHPLLACSIAGAVFIIERVYTLNRARVDTRKLMDRVLQALGTEGVDAALKVCEDTRGPVAAVVHAGLLRANVGPDAVREAIETAGAIEVSFLERGLVVIATVSTVSPMFGFLGTVSGMMHAFASIAAAEQVSAKIVASGIEEALITTIAGLCIAIPCTIAHSYCIGMIDRFVLEMEEASASLVAELARIGRS
jgi:biopolymer transport protein ExbB